MNYIVLDLEWNQAAVASKVVREPVMLAGEIIEFGAVRLRENRTPGETYKAYVAPHFYRRMHHMVKKLTGIRKEDLAAGRPFVEVWREFLSWCGEEAVLLTWGPDDIPILHANLLVSGLDPAECPSSFDLQKLFAATLAPEKRQYSLAGAMEILGLSGDSFHDALSDAVNTARICPLLNLENASEESLSFRYGADADGSVFRESREGWQSRRDILSDENIRTFACPACGENVSVASFLAKGPDKKISLVPCPCGKTWLLKVKIQKRKDGTFRSIRTLSAPEEEEILFWEEGLARRALSAPKQKK